MFMWCEERTSKSAETKHGKSSALFLTFKAILQRLLVLAFQAPPLTRVKRLRVWRLSTQLLLVDLSLVDVDLSFVDDEACDCVQHCFWLIDPDRMSAIFKNS